MTMPFDGRVVGIVEGRQGLAKADATFHFQKLSAEYFFAYMIRISKNILCNIIQYCGSK